MDSNNLMMTLYDIRDRCFIYSIMLSDASSSLGKMKIFFKLPAIFISVLLSVLNSSKFNETEEIKIVNTVFNALIALLIGVENTLQIDNKKQVFTSTKNKFEKLMSGIEKKLLDTSDPVSIEFVQNCITDFELIDDDLTFDIPKSVRNRVKRDFTGKRTLPLILGGDKRTEPLQLPTANTDNLQPELSQISKISQKLQELSQLQQLTQLPQLPQLPSQFLQPQLPQQVQHQQQLQSHLTQQLPQLPQQQSQPQQLQQQSQPQLPPQQSQFQLAQQLQQLTPQLPQVLQIIKPDLLHNTFQRLEENSALSLIPEQEQMQETIFDDILDENAPRQL